MNQAADCLEAAADYLRRNGLAKGVFFNSEGDQRPACTVGAIRYIGLEGKAANYDDAVVAVATLSRKIAPNDPRIAGPIYEWNDAPERTVEEVVDMLLDTAKDLRNAG